MAAQEHVRNADGKSFRVNLNEKLHELFEHVTRLDGRVNELWDKVEALHERCARFFVDLEAPAVDEQVGRRKRKSNNTEAGDGR